MDFLFGLIMLRTVNCIGGGGGGERSEKLMIPLVVEVVCGVKS